MTRDVSSGGSVLRGALCLLGTAFCWSFMGIFTKSNTQSPFLIGGVTATVMLAFIVVVGRPRFKLNRTVALAGLSAFGTAVTFNFANQLTTVGNAIVLQYTSMIFVIVYQAVSERRLPELRRIVVVVAAFAGMALFFMGSLTTEGLLGNVLAICSGATFGMQFFLNSRPEASPLTSASISCCCSIAVLLLFWMPQLPLVRPIEWGYMIASGAFCSGLANVLFSKGIGRVPAFSANLICMSEVVMAPTWSFLLFGERFSSTALLGAAVIVTSIVVNLALDARARRESGAGGVPA